MSSLGRFPSDRTTQALRQHAGGQGTQSTKEKAGDVLMCSGFSGAERLHPIFIAEPLAKRKTLGLSLIGAAVVMMSLPRCEGIMPEPRSTTRIRWDCRHRFRLA
jgi:hypothetical protein